jgi:hypothetical protein
MLAMAPMYARIPSRQISFPHLSSFTSAGTRVDFIELHRIARHQRKKYTSIQAWGNPNRVLACVQLASLDPSNLCVRLLSYSVRVSPELNQAGKQHIDLQK